MPRQLIKQGIGLRFAQLQVLEKVEHETNFVEGQANDIDENRQSSTTISMPNSLRPSTPGILPYRFLGPR